jgi:hypothetical protein
MANPLRRQLAAVDTFQGRHYTLAMETSLYQLAR